VNVPSHNLFARTTFSLNEHWKVVIGRLIDPGSNIPHRRRATEDYGGIWDGGGSGGRRSFEHHAIEKLNGSLQDTRQILCKGICGRQRLNFSGFRPI